MAEYTLEEIEAAKAELARRQRERQGQMTSNASQYSPEEIAAAKEELNNRLALKNQSQQPSAQPGNLPLISQLANRQPESMSERLANLISPQIAENRIMGDVTAGLGNLARNVLGESKREWGSIAPFISKYIPSGPSKETTEQFGGKSVADKLMQSLAENALNIMAPESAVVKGAISKIPMIGPSIAGAASRVLPQAAIGAATNEDPLSGGLMAGGVQAGLEAIPGAGKVIGKYAETINPINFSKNKLEDIRNALSMSEKAQKEAYKPFNAIAPYAKLEKTPAFEASLKKYEKYITPRVERSLDNFKEAPTLENAHKLQNRMISDIDTLNASSNPDIDKIQGLNYLRDSINKDIESSLAKIDEKQGTNILDSYLQGRQIHKEQIRPYKSTPSLASLISGEIEKIKPDRLHKSLQTAVEKNRVPENHYLREALQELNTKMNKANIAKYGVPSIAGAMLGQGIHSGLGPEVGLLAGAAMGNQLSHLTELAQNPEVQKLLAKLGSAGKNYVQPLIRGLVD